MSIIKNDSVIFYENNEITSSNIEEKVCQFCNAILKMFSENQKKILIYLDSGPDILYSILSILKTYNIYIPIEPGIPLERLNYIFENSKPDLIISSYKYKNIFIEKKVIYIEDIYLNENSFLENIIENNLMSFENNNKIAYIIYTSGTTGIPKGVEITYSNILNFINGIVKEIDFDITSTFICYTNIAFDIFFVESVLPLLLGKKVVLLNDIEKKTPLKVIELIKKYKVDMLQMTPSRLNFLCEFDKTLSFLNDVKVIMIGGEKLPNNLFSLLKTNSKSKIYNVYGPTETTIWSTVSDLTNSDNINIGKPLLNTKIYILNSECTELKENEIGEICISGSSVSKGYHNDKILTAKKFKILKNISDKIIYFTGDLGYFDEKGNYYCLGRTDNQIKMNGYRIELEEIEITANMYENIENSISFVDDNKLKLLYKGSKKIAEQELKNYLSTKLPYYMIPIEIYKIENFELNSNGKIDRKKTIEEFKKKNTKLENFYIKNEELDVSKKVINIFENILKHTVFLDDSIKNLGIDSLTFVELIIELEEKFDIIFDDEMLISSSFKTIQSFIDYIKKRSDYND